MSQVFTHHLYCRFTCCIDILLTGWTVFDRLYVLNGIVYVVTDEPDKAPDVANMYSKGLFIYEGFEAEQTRLPGDDEIQIISTKKAHEMFGSGAQIIDGVTVSYLHS